MHFDAGYKSQLLQHGYHRTGFICGSVCNDSVRPCIYHDDPFFGLENQQILEEPHSHNMSQQWKAVVLLHVVLWDHAEEMVFAASLSGNILGVLRRFHTFECYCDWAVLFIDEGFALDLQLERQHYLFPEILCVLIKCIGQFILVMRLQHMMFAFLSLYLLSLDDIVSYLNSQPQWSHCDGSTVIKE